MYQNFLNEKFVGRFMTPNTIEIMTREVENLRRSYAARETNPIWKIQIEIVAKTPGTVEVIPKLTADMELIDRMNPTKGFTRNNY